MGATSHSLRGLLSLKKNTRWPNVYRGKGKIEMCPRFQPRERGGGRGDILPSIPFRNDEVPGSAAIELLTPGLQPSSTVAHCLWWRAMSTARAPPLGSCLKWWHGNTKDPSCSLGCCHPTLWVIPHLENSPRVWLRIPLRHLRHGHSLASPSTDPAPSPSSSLWGVLITGTPSESLECSVSSQWALPWKPDLWPQRNGHTVDKNWIVGMIWLWGSRTCKSFPKEGHLIMVETCPGQPLWAIVNCMTRKVLFSCLHGTNHIYQVMCISVMPGYICTTSLYGTEHFSQG